MGQEKRKFRVLHLIDSLDLGGAQTLLLAWFQTYDRSQFEIDLASMHGTKRSLFYQRVRESDIPVILLSPWRWMPFYLLRLPLMLITGRYDVVHCHLFASNWLGKPLARIFRVPVVISHDHCNDSVRAKSPLITSLDGVANRFADRIFAVSRSIRDYLMKFENIPGDKIQVVRNGLAERMVTKRGAQRTKVIGGAGRLVPQKNFERFLRIARVLQEIDPSYRFVIAGSGPLDQLLRRKAVELGVQVEWLGAQPSLDLFFSSIDMFLLTSDFEGLPMTVLEAFQSGVPAAAMAVDGLREEFTDELALLDPNSSDLEIGGRIHTLLQDRTELSAQIQRGIEVVSRRFSALTQVREIERAYLELLQTKKNRA
jgi:L-malate glycosyltransferase